MKHALYALALLAAVAAHHAAAAHEARPLRWEDTRLAQYDRRSQPRVPMGDAMDLVQRRTGGRVLSAQPASQGGREGYRIKVLTRSGEVRVFFVDAHTGTVQQD